MTPVILDLSPEPGVGLPEPSEAVPRRPSDSTEAPSWPSSSRRVGRAPSAAGPSGRWRTSASASASPFRASAPVPQESGPSATKRATGRPPQPPADSWARAAPEPGASRARGLRGLFLGFRGHFGAYTGRGIAQDRRSRVPEGVSPKPSAPRQPLPNPLLLSDADVTFDTHRASVT